MDLSVCPIATELFAWGRHGGFGKCTRTIGSILWREGSTSRWSSARALKLYVNITPLNIENRRKTNYGYNKLRARR